MRAVTPNADQGKGPRLSRLISQTVVGEVRTESCNEPYLQHGVSLRIMSVVKKQAHQLKPRRWSERWWNCFGNCTAAGWHACCLVYWLPCVAYGLNSRKVLHKSFWLEALAYVLILGLVAAAVVVDFVRSQSCDAALAVATGKAQEMPIRWDALIAERHAKAAHNICTSRSLNYSLACFAASLMCLLYWAIFVGGRRRRQLREALGIPVTDHRGTCCSCCHIESDSCNSDCCLHFWCTKCAMCQETRTILEAEREQYQATNQAVAAGYAPLLVAPAKERAMARRDSAKDSYIAGEKLITV